MCAVISHGSKNIPVYNFITVFAKYGEVISILLLMKMNYLTMAQFQG